MRLAIFGGVARDSGSGPSGYYLILESLLRRGQLVDFYAICNFGIPHELCAFRNFRLIEVRIATADRVLDFLMNRLPRPVAFITSYMFNLFRELCYNRRIGDRIYNAHLANPYDLVLVVDRMSAFPRWPDLPCLSWPQGCPAAELETLCRLRKQVVRFCGQAFFLGCWLYYRWRIGLTRQQIAWSRGILCGSRFSQAYWLRFGGKPGRVFPVPFPVDLDRFRPHPSATGPPKPFTFLHLGRIVPRKRLDLLLEGFQLLRREEPDVQLLLAGDIPVAREYRRLFEAPDLSPGVHFLGRIDRIRVPDLLRSAGALVQTSENENFGTAVMEALACGIPVIVGPTNGTRDYVSDRSVVFDRYTPHAVYQAMKAMNAACLKNWALVRADARQAAERHFDPELVTDRLLAICRSLESRPAHPFDRPRTAGNGSGATYPAFRAGKEFHF
jgi:glycosyltransferase involved in cell wall biosynthesis